MIRTQINLEEEQYRLLAFEAKRLNRSISDLIRESVEKQFVKKVKTFNASALLELAKHAVDFKKINPAVPDDLAENHDEYLYGKKSKWAYLWQSSRRKKGKK